MRSRRLGLSGMKRLVATMLIAVGLVLGAAALVVSVLSSGNRTAHAASPSSGVGGGCFSTTPVCTFKESAAFADFDSSTDGCVATSGFIQAFQDMTHSPPGRPTTEGPFVGVFVLAFDVCQGIEVRDAANLDFTGTVQLGSTSGVVTGTANMFDIVSNTTFPLTINVTWQAIGPAAHQIDSTHTQTPHFIFSSHFNGTTHVALASGTLSDGVTNFAPRASLSAGLSSVRSGMVQVGEP